MGRDKIEIDPEAIFDLASMGLNQKQMAEEIGVSVPTLAKRIGKLSEEHGVIAKYRTVQSLELTKLQAKILACMTAEKIEEASLGDLVKAFKILKDKEFMVEGKPTEIKGLVAYLIHMEKENLVLADAPQIEDDEVIDAEVTDEEFKPEL